MTCLLIFLSLIHRSYNEILLIFSFVIPYHILSVRGRYIAIRQKNIYIFERDFECLQKYRKKWKACGSIKETGTARIAMRFYYSLCATHLQMNNARATLLQSHTCQLVPANHLVNATSFFFLVCLRRLRQHNYNCFDFISL